MTSSARTIAVTSGKGGVGKTNVAVNLAIALADLGRRVVLWDMDLGLANVDVLLNIKVSADLGDVLAGRLQLEEIIVTGPGGVHVIPGASGDERLANLADHQVRALVNDLERLTHQADFIIIDTGAGLSRHTLQFAAGADEVLLVTTPEPTAMLDAYAVVKLLSRDSAPSEIHLLVNMARDVREARNTIWRITASAENFIGSHLQEDGYILFDKAVGDAVRRRTPVLLAAPESAASKSIRTIADLIDKAAPLSIRREAPEAHGFVKRLFRALARR